jgi:uncharacterized membrane protein YqjE
MATVHPIHSRRHDPAAHPEPDTVVTALVHLARLELELGLAETKRLIRRLLLAVAVAVPCAVAAIAAIVVLLAAAAAPLFDAPWQHLLVAGGAVLLLALAGLAWSAWRVKSLEWPRETLSSFEENWRWLGAQLRSRLTWR